MESDRYENLVRQHKDRVYSYAAWMLRDPEEARDVAQEALVRLWQNRRKVEETGAKSWLLTTAHHLCIDRLRRQQRRPELPAETARETGQDERPDPFHRAASTETGRAIGTALAALGPRDRAAVLMREVEGMTYREMARVLGIPLGTVKARLHRARERLRERLVKAGVTP